MDQSLEYDLQQVEAIRELFKKAEATPDKNMKIEAAIPINQFLHNSYAGVRVCLKVIDKLQEQIEELTVRDIVSSNPGIDIDEVREYRKSQAS